jgi:hypothetical protein
VELPWPDWLLPFLTTTARSLTIDSEESGFQPKIDAVRDKSCTKGCDLWRAAVVVRGVYGDCYRSDRQSGRLQRQSDRAFTQ